MCKHNPSKPTRKTNTTKSKLQTSDHYPYSMPTTFECTVGGDPKPPPPNRHSKPKEAENLQRPFLAASEDWFWNMDEHGEQVFDM